MNKKGYIYVQVAILFIIAGAMLYVGAKMMTARTSSTKNKVYAEELNIADVQMRNYYKSLFTRFSAAKLTPFAANTPVANDSIAYYVNSRTSGTPASGLILCDAGVYTSTPETIKVVYCEENSNSSSCTPLRTIDEVAYALVHPGKDGRISSKRSGNTLYVYAAGSYTQNGITMEDDDLVTYMTLSEAQGLVGCENVPTTAALRLPSLTLPAACYSASLTRSNIEYQVPDGKDSSDYYYYTIIPTVTSYSVADEFKDIYGIRLDKGACLEYALIYEEEPFIRSSALTAFISNVGGGSNWGVSRTIPYTGSRRCSDKSNWKVLDGVNAPTYYTYDDVLDYPNLVGIDSSTYEFFQYIYEYYGKKVYFDFHYYVETSDGTQEVVQQLILPIEECK